MYIDDQLYRSGSKKELRNKVIQYDTIKIDSIIKVISRKGFYFQKEYDKKNAIKLTSIISKYGFPEEKIIGFSEEKKDYQDTWTPVGLITIHSFWIKETNDTLKKLLFQEVKKGNCLPDLYAYSVDYFETSKSPFQIYGTGNVIKFSIPPFHVSPVRDPSNLNLRRAEVGLEPIENYWRKHKLVKRKITSKYK
jgi:hypothetical protein